MFVVPALVSTQSPPHLNDGAVLVGKDAVTFDLSPLMSLRWLAQVIGAIVYLSPRSQSSWEMREPLLQSVCRR